ncbi:3-deoxy-D-manno-octulosonic acid transferase [Pirellulimonas nuda]|uniref:3-deoxy-D-manno-octulosonic acid transferase n=1 Tax=Pirellulimonas nuda TaxID=2528009 RepID=A0A518D9P6_9BACT|nr:3-deoxy-D-manno-octulosonic acid transferase [Pirellulimonas nuda]QDU88158.1 3-deoxy-D-manno-octulosonic acid transferase [Pirellulimonas nuda]
MNRLIAWTLNLAYLLAIAALSPVIAWKAWRTGKYRDGYAEKLLGRVPKRAGDRPCVWLHAVSVGEVNLLGTLIGELRRRRPEWELAISTTTRAGMELARRKYGAEHTVFYCPLDFSWAVNAAMRRVRPGLLVLAELELWPNLIGAAKSHGAKVAIVNGRLSERSFAGYQRIGPLVRRVIRQVDRIAAQDEATAERFRCFATDPNKTSVTGSLKYDGAETNRENAKTVALRQQGGLSSSARVWLVGSTQAPEEEIALRVFGRVSADHPDLHLILVPRHPERFAEVANLLRATGQAFERRSALSPAASPQPPAPRRTRILLVDTVGELGAWWGTATIGFVGGSLGSRGGQNMIEPAAYGVATSFGPNTRNFRDIVAALLAAGGAQVTADEAEMEAFIRRCLTEPAFAVELGSNARNLVASQLGATGRTVDLLDSLLTKTRRAAA